MKTKQNVYLMVDGKLVYRLGPYGVTYTSDKSFARPFKSRNLAVAFAKRHGIAGDVVVS